MKRAAKILALLAVASCSGRNASTNITVSEEPLWMDVASDSGTTLIISISPFDGSRDTLVVGPALENVVCMSSTQVAGFSAIGAQSVISGVSGVNFLSDSTVRANAFEAGYEGSMDYERILASETQLVLGYMTSAVEPEYFTKLRNLGIRVFPVHEHLEHHPLARASYVKMYGAMTGRSDVADSLYLSVARRYHNAAAASAEKKKVLINIPYGDMWYVPAKDSYMSILVNDAGGEILGTRESTASSVISIEEAYSYAKEAQVWLHPGQCSTKDDMIASNASFKNFHLERMKVWNNTGAMNEQGGNGFWESGALRPDLVLEDLAAIFKEESSHKFIYYRKVE